MNNVIVAKRALDCVREEISQLEEGLCVSLLNGWDYEESCSRLDALYSQEDMWLRAMYRLSYLLN